MAKEKVFVLGGGVAGMSAAHLLAQRGFAVEVFEIKEKYVGGKARSVDVPGTSIPPGAELWLPGEHGFRFFPGFYKHLPDTMSQIPVGEGTSVVDNLVDTQNVMFLQSGSYPMLIPLHLPNSIKDLVDMLLSIPVLKQELSLAEIEFFAARIWQLMTSCPDRYLDEYEMVSWWEYTAAANFSTAYQALLVDGITRSLVAAKADKASTNTVGTIFLQLLYTMLHPEQSTDRVLNAPTNDAWLSPWLSILTSSKMGVTYHHGQKLTRINMASEAAMAPVASVQIADAESGAELGAQTADYYVLAVPVEVAAEVIQASPEVLVADDSLKSILELAPNVEWMNGIQYYLTEPFDMHQGHSIYVNSNWALTSISQIQFWPDYDLEKRFGGKAKGILSVDISDWTTAGNFNGKKAEDCTRTEVIEEVWAQLKQEINQSLMMELTDDMRVFAYLDEDIYVLPGSPLSDAERAGLDIAEEDGTPVKLLGNKEPLLVNLINSWTLRPNSFTSIPNLFLAADYVKTYTSLATMEAANEAARRAVNNILDVSGSTADPCELWPLWTPEPLVLLRIPDQQRWGQGLAWKNPVDDLV